MKIKIKGKITSDESGVKVRFSSDLVRYYNWFMLKHTGMILNTPRFGAKVSIYNPKQHNHLPNSNLSDYVNKTILVEIDPTQIIYRMSNKGYWVCWMNIECEVLWDLISDLGLYRNFDKLQRPHMSISNGKYAVRSNG